MAYGRCARILRRSLGRDLDVTVKRVGATPVLTASGEIDLASAPALEAAISEAMTPPPDQVVIDLLGITFMDSSGIGALVSAKQDNPGTEVTLVVSGGVVQKLIDITGLKGRFRVVDAVEAALRPPDSQPSSNT